MKNIKFPRKKVENSGFLQRLTDFFDKENLHNIALESKFIQRSTSKIEGLAFLSLNVFEEASLFQRSLNDECDFLESEFGTIVSKQSLDERYNTYAVKFLKMCFAKMLTDVLVKSTENSAFIEIFNRIRIGDSTSFKLPANLSPFYQSGGGDTGPSSIKMFYEFDLIKGEFLELQIGCGRKNDADFLQNGLSIKPKDLVIKDLGFYQHKEFKKIDANGGYFISRFKSKTNLYKKNLDGEFEKVNLTNLLSEIESLSSVHLFLGEEKQPVRLVIAPLPDKVTQKRLKQLIKTSKHKKWKLSSDRKLLCGFNIYITNIAQNVEDQSILDLYALRWQIELLFKIWKSLFKINEIGHTNIFRFECYILGRLIALCLSQNIQGIFKEHLLMKGFEPSEWKSFKIIKKNFKITQGNS
jgi:Transposase DDE domain